MRPGEHTITRASLKRKLWRDLRGTSGWKSLKVLLQAARKEQGYGIARKIVVALGDMVNSSDVESVASGSFGNS